MFSAIPDVLVISARAFGVLLFSAALIGKLRHFERFVSGVAAYRLLPGGTHSIAAATIVASEVAVVLSLASGLFASEGALLAILLLLVFAGAMAVVILRGETDVDCGCFFGQAKSHPVSALLVARNFGAAALLAPAALRSVPLDAVSALDLLDGAGFAVGCVLLNELLGQLVGLRNSRDRLFRGPA